MNSEKFIVILVVNTDSHQDELVPILYRSIEQAQSRLPEFVEQWRGYRREISDVRTFPNGYWYLYTGSPDYYFIAREVPVIQERILEG